jgi:aminoglycoside 6-adenylyltransferase
VLPSATASDAAGAAERPGLTYEQLIERIVQWAEACPDVRAAIIVGSRARADHAADEWSDLDLLLLTTDTERYLTQTDWLESIGNPWLTFLERTPGGQETERRVLFEGGLDVDFVPLLAGRAQQIAHDPLVSAIIRRGTRVLLDKDGIAAPMTSPTAQAKTVCYHPPVPEDFLETVNDFWYHAVWTTKKLCRGELWTAKACCDIYMKRLLLRMIEWHARALEGWDYDVWFQGRFLEQWAPPRVVGALRCAFAQYHEADVWRALLATMDMFHCLAIEVAKGLSYPYPAAAEGHVTAWVAAHMPAGIGSNPNHVI